MANYTNKKNSRKGGRNVSKSGSKANNQRNNYTKDDRGMDDNIHNDDSKHLTVHGRTGGSVRNSSNDISWYSSNPQLLKDTASLSFGVPNGNQIEIPSTSTTFRSKNIGPQPGIMTLAMAPMFGVTKDMNSPINIAARNIYSYVRHVNAGHANYDITDLMNYILGMDSLYSYYQWLCRLYGLSSYYAVKNKYTAVALIEANGVSANTIINNLADFRAFINMCANKISSLCVPAGMPFTKRHMWLYSNVYKDANSEKAQLYMFVPDRFYKYNETEAPYYLTSSAEGTPTRTQYTDALGWMEPTAFRCRTTKGQLNRTQKSLDNLKAEFNAMINAMMGSEDVGIISGDILKAFGANGIMALAPIDETYSILPVYDPEVLDQIHNSVSLGVNIDKVSTDTESTTWNTRLIESGYFSFGSLYQDVEGSELAPVLFNETDLMFYGVMDSTREGNIPYPWDSKIIDLPYDHCTPDDVMIATRLVPSTSIDYVQGNKFSYAEQPYYLRESVTSCSADVVMSIEIHYFWNFSGYLDSLTHINCLQSYNNTRYYSAHDLSKWTKFDRAPLLYVTDRVVADDELTMEPNAVIGDFENYTVITTETLRRLDEVAMISMLDTPTAASYKYVH